MNNAMINKNVTDTWQSLLIISLSLHLKETIEKTVDGLWTMN